MVRLKHISKFNKIMGFSLFFIAILSINSCTLGRALFYNFAEIDDHKIFDYHEIKAPQTIFEFETANISLSIDSLHIKDEDNVEYNIDFDKFLIDNNTVAFLVIKNDSIKYEKYFDNYSDSSLVNSFSMSKSIVSMLIGCAIDDGYIESADQIVTDFLPEMKDNGFDSLKINHLLDMSSCVEYGGRFNPLDEAIRFYYTKNMRKEITKLELKQTPGTKFEYRNYDTQLLGLIIERALDTITLSDYLEQKLWLPLGMEYNALWSIDGKNSDFEKAFCCLNARTRDFAKLGRLYLNKGMWNGERIISEEWIDVSTQIDTTKGNGPYYNNQWWVNADSTYAAIGLLGQYIYISPKTNTIIVRLGKNNGKTANWLDLFSLINSKLILGN